MKNILIFFLIFGLIFSKVANAENEPIIFEEQTLDEKIEKIEEESKKKNSITSVIEKVLASTVSIEAIKLSEININKNGSYFIIEKSGSVVESGAGFLINEEGYIITNSHVVENANKIVVKLNEKEYQAEFVGNDLYLDIALLKINDNKKFQFLELKPDVDIKLGEKVIAIGNPYNLGLSISKGIISALHRDIKDTGYNNMIQTDANMNRGNSGGPIFNEYGDVIGISSIIFSPEGGRNIGINFAIPIADIIKTVERLREFGFIERGWIGIKGVDATDDIFRILNSKRETGILVEDVFEGGPADKAGILPGDIIISYNHKHIKNFNNLIQMIRNTSVNTSVSVLILRGGKYIKLKVVVKDLPDDSSLQEINNKIINNSVRFLDMTVTQIDKISINKFKLFNNYDGKAMYVLAVDKGGIADKNGIEAGDLLFSVNQVQLKDKNILENLIENLNKNKQNDVIVVVKKAKNFENVIIKTSIK